jgi:hypothetical protein
MKRGCGPAATFGTDEATPTVFSKAGSVPSPARVPLPGTAALKSRITSTSALSSENSALDSDAVNGAPGWPSVGTKVTLALCERTEGFWPVPQSTTPWVCREAPPPTTVNARTAAAIMMAAAVNNHFGDTWV